MKIMRNILAAAVMTTSAAVIAQNPQSWRVNVPFDFTVRHTSLPAGTYTVQESGPVIILTSYNGKTANVLTNNKELAKPSKVSSLTFNVNDGQYDLTQVKYMGSSTELIAVVGKRSPRKLEASNVAQTIEVAAVGTR